MKRKNILSLFLILLVLMGCEKKEDNGETDYNFQLTPRGESEVLISWSEDQMGRRVNFTLASTADFSEIISQAELETAEESVVLDGLSPLKNYFLKIEVFAGVVVIWNQDIDFTSGYTMEAVSYETSDGLEISCALHYISTQLSSSSKRIIFMHEYGATKTSWISTGLIDSLVKDGNLCATFDFRGHGSSDRIGDNSILLENPGLLIEDFKACIQYIENSNPECSEQTLVFGASLGAAIACGAGSFDYVIGGVAASAPAKLADLILQGKSPKGMFYIAGELDVTSKYDFGLDAHSLFEITEAPKQVEVITKSGDHGTSLLDINPQLNARALLWARSL